MKIKGRRNKAGLLRSGRRFLAGLISLIIAAGTMSSSLGGLSARAEGEGNEKGKVEVSLTVAGKNEPDDIEDGVSIYRFPSGRNISGEVNLSVSGAELNYEYAYMKVWFPKADDPSEQYVKNVAFIDSIAASSSERSDPADPDEYSIIYNFRNLYGGFDGDYIFGFRFENLITPNGARQPLHVGVYDKEGNLIVEKQLDVIFEAQAETNYTVNKNVYSSKYKSWNVSREVAEESELAEKTPSDPTQTAISFYNIFTPVLEYSAVNGEGEYRAKRFKVIDTLPDGAQLDPAKNPGWTAVEGTDNQYEKIIEKDSSPYNISAPIVLSFPEQPYGPITEDTKYKRKTRTTQSFVNRSEFFVDKGEGFESVGTSEASVSYTVYLNTGGRGLYFNKRIEDPNNNIVNNIMLINGDGPRDYRLFKDTADGPVPVYPPEKAQAEAVWT